MAGTKNKRKRIKRTAFAGILFLSLLFACWYGLRYHLSSTVNILVRTIFGADIRSDSITIGDGKIIVLNPSLYYGGEFIGKADRIEGTWTTESLRRWRLAHVVAYGTEAVIIRDDQDINAVTAFVGSKNKESRNRMEKLLASLKDSDPVEKEKALAKAKQDNTEAYQTRYLEKKRQGKQPGSRVPIDKITVIDGVCTYIDRTFKNEIKKKVRGINGFITFTKGEGVYIEAEGEDRDERYRYIFSNKDQRYWMDIDARNVTPRKEWIQYGYQGDDVAVWGGKIDLRMEIGSDTKYKGVATAKGVGGKYVYYNEEAKNVEGTVTFDGKKLMGEASADVLGHRENVIFSYDGISRFYLNSKIHDVSGKDIEKYHTLEKNAIDLGDFLMAAPEMDLLYDSKGEPKLNMSFRSDRIRWKNYSLDHPGWNIRRGKEGYEITNIRGNMKMYRVSPEEEIPISDNDLDLSWKFVTYDKGKVEFSVRKSNSSYIPPLKGSFSYELDDIRTHVAIDADIARFTVDYFPRTGQIVAGKRGDFTLSYDTEAKVITEGGGNIPVDLKYAQMDIDFRAENNVIRLEKVKIVPKASPEKPRESSGKKEDKSDRSQEPKKKQEGDEIKAYTKSEETTLEKYREEQWTRKDPDQLNEIIFKGTIDLNKKTLDLQVKAEDFLLDQDIKGENLKIRTALEGVIKKRENSERFDVGLDIRRLSVRYLAEILNLQGKLNIGIADRLYSRFDGEIGAISFKDYATYGIRFAYSLKDGILGLRSLKNEIFDIKGDIDLEKKQTKLQYTITSLQSTKLKLNAPVSFYVAKAAGILEGTFENPRGTAGVEEAKILLPDGGEILLKGALRYENDEVLADHVSVNGGRLSGKYNVYRKNYTMELQMDGEENLSAYFLKSDLRQKTTGKLIVSGKGRSIDAKADLKLRENYFKWRKLPDIAAEIQFKSDDFAQGIIRFKNLTLLNEAGKKLAAAAGEINLDEEKINIALQEGSLLLQDIPEYTGLKDLRGTMKVSGGITGDLRNFDYKVQVKSTEAYLATLRFNDLSLNMGGNFDRIDIQDLSFLYSKNHLKAHGYQSLRDDRYAFRVESSGSDLRFLNFILADYGLSNISGMTSLDLTLENEGNKGYLQLKDFSMNMDQYHLKLSGVEGRINLDKKTVSVDKLTGKLNDGNLVASGKINNFTLDALESANRLEELDYNVDMKLRDVHYKFGKQFQLLCAADLNFAKNRLAGVIEIKDGEVMALPIEARTVFQILADLLFKSTSKIAQSSRDLGKDFQVDLSYYKPVDVDLSFAIKNGVKLDVTDVNAFVGDLKGILFAEGTLRGKGVNLVLLGEAEVREGSLTLNENGFVVDRAVLSFTNKEDYLPDLNPTVSIEARVNVSGEEVKVGINGDLDRLRFQVASMNGGSSGDLRGLLAGELDVQDEVTAKLVRMILNDQLSQTFLRPITRRIKKAFGLSKFRVKSDILNEKKSRYGEESSELQFNAILEAENNLYKDKLFWVTSVTLVDGNTYTRNAEADDGTLREYDVSLEYRYKLGRSFTLGAGRVPDYKKKESRRNEKRKDAVNYHVGFRFEKKLNRLTDLWK